MTVKIQEVESELDHEELDFFIKVLFRFNFLVAKYVLVFNSTHTIFVRLRKYPKKKSHLAGLEPATFRLTAERANQLRHKCSCCDNLTLRQI